MVQIISAILTNSSDEFEKTIRLIEPYSDRVHLDIADGIFVSNKTISGYSELDLISTNLKFDVHLMVKNPLDQLSYWNNPKANRFIIHIESENVAETIKKFRSMNKTIGLTLNPNTSINDIEPFINLVDFIQFMTVNPGFQGGEFVDNVVDKIRNFHEKYPELILAVDGGINPVTAKKLANIGISIFVSGSFILKSEDVGKAIEELKKISENINNI